MCTTQTETLLNAGRNNEIVNSFITTFINIFTSQTKKASHYFIILLDSSVCFKGHVKNRISVSPKIF